ncbi:MAG: TIGR02206 family membrane protein [Clostridia bacterium]
MRDFFTYKGGVGLEIFGFTHILVTCITIICAVAIFIFRHKLRKWKQKDKMRYVIAGILFTNMAIYYISLMLNGIYTWKTDLPFHLCFITGYTFMLAMVMGSKKLYKVVYFFTFVGPLPAIILPDTTQNLGFQLGPDRFIFYQYVISHHFLILSSLYTLFVLNYEIKLKDVIPAFIYGNILVGTMTAFNTVCGTNYIMVFELPPHIVKLLPFLNYGIPILWLESAAIAALCVSYLPVYLMNKADKKYKIKSAAVAV